MNGRVTVCWSCRYQTWLPEWCVGSFIGNFKISCVPEQREPKLHGQGQSKHVGHWVLCELCSCALWYCWCVAAVTVTPAVARVTTPAFIGKKTTPHPQFNTLLLHCIHQCRCWRSPPDLWRRPTQRKENKAGTSQSNRADEDWPVSLPPVCQCSSSDTYLPVVMWNRTQDQERDKRQVTTAGIKGRRLREACIHTQPSPAGSANSHWIVFMLKYRTS